jgi:isopenicillin N synthase-like dioxygenase
VPVLDFASATGDQLVAALQENSCVFLTGLDAFAADSFGADLDLMLAASREFFELDPAEKARVRWSGEGEWVGWQPLYEGGPTSLLLERYELALPDPAGFPSDREWASTFTMWPEQPAALAPTWAAYYRTARSLVNRIIEMIVESIGLPAEDLGAWTTRQHSNLCVNHYIAQEEPPAPGQTRQKAHTDIGGLTLLWADGAAGGLEAQIGPDGSWVPVHFPPGAILLQAGDLLTLWTRGRIPGNNHRVVNPPREPGAKPTDRYSVVFFHHPDLDTWVAPADADAADAAGVGAREHVLARQQAAYTG